MRHAHGTRVIATKRKSSRPPAHNAKFKPEYAKVVTPLCRLGLINDELAEVFDVSVATIERWCRDDHGGFGTAVRKGRLMADAKVVASLYKRANGYSHPALDIRVVDGEVVETEYTKHYPPDTVACIFWLKNRRPDLWRDRKEFEHKGNVTLTALIEASYEEEDAASNDDEDDDDDFIEGELDTPRLEESA